MRASQIAVVAVLLVAGCGDSKSPAGGAAQPTIAGGTAAPSNDVQNLTFTAADGTVIDYVLVTPPSRVFGEPGRVLIAFPPGGQDLDTTQAVVRSKWEDEAVKRGWVVVSPAAPSTGGLYYSDESAALVPEFLDKIEKDYPPQGGRFDLAGVSNGGLSAFKVALSYPDRFRSLVVFPGYSQVGGDDPDLSKLKNIGVSMFVGGDDTGWREASELTDKTLKALGYKVELHVVNGSGHIIEGLSGADLFDAIDRMRA